MRWRFATQKRRRATLSLPVENRGGSDQAEGGLAYDVKEICLVSVKVISPGNAAGKSPSVVSAARAVSNDNLSKWSVRQYPSQSRSITVEELQKKKSSEQRGECRGLR